MDRNQLLSSAVEMGLDLIERDGTFITFCRAVNAAGETFVYTPASNSGKPFTAAQAAESVLASVRRDLDARNLVGAAFCYHTRIRFADSPEKVTAIEVELHSRGEPSAVWYFPYRLDGGTAKVLESHTTASKVNLFSDGEHG